MSFYARTFVWVSADVLNQRNTFLLPYVRQLTNVFLFVLFTPHPHPRLPLCPLNKTSGVSQPIYTTSALDNHTVLTNHTTEDTGSSSDSASSIVLMAEDATAAAPGGRSNSLPAVSPSTQIWSPTGQFCTGLKSFLGNHWFRSVKLSSSFCLNQSGRLLFSSEI